MRPRLTAVLLAVMGLICTTAVVSLAQTRDKSNAASAKDAESRADAKYRRLPTGFGALDLSDEQKEEIYSVRAEYGKQIEELEEQLEKIRKEMDGKLKGVLTSAQKKALAAVTSEESSDASPAPPRGSGKTRSASSSRTRSEGSSKSSDKDATDEDSTSKKKDR